MSAPRDNLVREMPFEVTRTEEDGDGLTFEGYAAVWDSPTEINSRAEGNFIERIKPGAFTRTLAKMPVFMFNHGQHPVIGDMPLGVIQEAREDAHGLFVQARLSDNWLVQPVRDAIAEGSIRGMSFRMSIPDGGETWRHAKGDQLAERDIHEIKCYELGPVVFPAYEATSAAVRSADLAELARVLFHAQPDDEERMDMEAAQLALRDAIKLHQSQMDGGVPTESQQQLLNHLLNARALLSGGHAEMKSADDPDDTISRDEETVAEPDPGDEPTPAEETPDPADEATPRGDAQEQRILRLLEAQRLGVEITNGSH